MELLKVTLNKEPHLIVETLQRMGIVSNWEKKIYPSCYLYQEGENYFLCHFKELFMITNPNAYNNIEDIDISRRNSIALLLKRWGMIECDLDEKTPTIFVKVISHEEKESFTIKHKFDMAKSLEKKDERQD